MKLTCKHKLFCMFLDLTACGDQPTEEEMNCRGSYYIAEGFEPEEELAITEAARRWNEWSTHTAVRIGEHGYCSIESGSLKGTPDSVQARWVPDNGMIVIDRSRLKQHCMTLDCQESVIMHELGHSFGLKHLPSTEIGIMSYPTAAWDFTEADRRACLASAWCPHP